MDQYVYDKYLKLKDWIPIEKIDWRGLSVNPNAISMLEKHPERIHWYELSNNPNAIHVLEKYPEKIDWYMLSENPNAIHVLEKYPKKINWYWLSKNPSIFEIDYGKIKEHNIIFQELVEKVFHPKNIYTMYNKYSYDISEN